MIPALKDNSASDSTLRSHAIAWCVAALLSGALIGLVHDPNYATASGAELVEDGRGIEDKAVMEEGLDAAKSGRLIGLASLFAVAGVCLLTMPRDVSIRWDGLSLLVGMGLLWAVASVAWSTERGTTIRELVRLFMYIGVAAILARRFNPRTLCFVLAAALGGSVLAAVAFEVGTGGFRPWIAGYRLTGSMHSNVLAVQAAVVALIAYAFAVGDNQRNAIWWAVFLTASVVVYLSGARTALITVVAGVAAVHVAGRPSRNWLLFATTGATCAALALMAALMLGLLDGRESQRFVAMGRTDDVEALTGRVPLWNFVWQESAGHRLQGFGWGAFWVVERTLSARDELGWFPRHSHNAYLHVFVNLGFVGVAIAVAVGGWALARTWRLVERTGLPEFSALAAVLVGIFVNGIAESAFVMPRDMGLFAAAAVFSVIVIHQRAAFGLREPAKAFRSAMSPPRLISSP